MVGAAGADYDATSMTDPTGDAAGGPDIVGASTSYDRAGRWTVTVRFAEPLVTIDGSRKLNATIVDGVAPGGASCAQTTTTFAGLSGGLSPEDSYVFFSPPAGEFGSQQGARQVSDDGRSMTFSASDDRLLTFGAPCVSIAVEGLGAKVGDVLDTPLRVALDPQDAEPGRAPTADDPAGGPAAEIQTAPASPTDAAPAQSAAPAAGDEADTGLDLGDTEGTPTDALDPYGQEPAQDGLGPDATSGGPVQPPVVTPQGATRGSGGHGNSSITPAAPLRALRPSTAPGAAAFAPRAASTRTGRLLGVEILPGCAVTCGAVVRVSLTGATAERAGLTRTQLRPLVLLVVRQGAVRPNGKLRVVFPAKVKRTLARQPKPSVLVSITVSSGGRTLTKDLRVLVS